MKYLLIVLLLGGCANVSYKKDGASPSEIAAANRECKYDVAKSTNSNNVPYSMADAVSSGVLIAQNRNELMMLCLESKGFTRQSGN